MHSVRYGIAKVVFVFEFQNFLRIKFSISYKYNCT